MPPKNNSNNNQTLGLGLGLSKQFMISSSPPNHNNPSGSTTPRACAAAKTASSSTPREQLAAAASESAKVSSVAKPHRSVAEAERDNKPFSQTQLEADSILFAHRIHDLALDTDLQPKIVRRGVIPALLGFLRAKEVSQELISESIICLMLLSSHPKNREFLRKESTFLRTISELHEDVLPSSATSSVHQQMRDQCARIIRNLGLSVTATIAKHASNVSNARRSELVAVAARRSYSQIQKDQDNNTRRQQQQQQQQQLQFQASIPSPTSDAVSPPQIPSPLGPPNDVDINMKKHVGFVLPQSSDVASPTADRNYSNTTDDNDDDTIELAMKSPQSPVVNNNSMNNNSILSSSSKGGGGSFFANNNNFSMTLVGEDLEDTVNLDVMMQRRSSAYFPQQTSSSDNAAAAAAAATTTNNNNNRPSRITNELKEVDIETAFACLENIENEEQIRNQHGSLSNLKLKKLKTKLSEAERLQEAAHIIRRDSAAKDFRSKSRFALAALAIGNCVQVLIFFFLVHPPGMNEGLTKIKTNNFTTQQKATTPPAVPTENNNNNNNNRADYWELPDEVDEEYHPHILFLEGLFQLFVSITALCIFFLQSLTRNAELFKKELHFIPRNAETTNEAAENFFNSKQLVEMGIWCIHCPIGLAHSGSTEEYRYINGLCVLRLYTIVRAAMDMTQFKSSMVRVMSNFFGLRLTTGVFLRWALEFHKWSVLIPTLVLLFSFQVLCFSFAEGTSLDQSVWFIATVYSTNGFGDIVPATKAGRVVTVSAMMVGLVVLAYIVSQVQTLVTREEHEQKVLDALTLSKFRGQSKEAAAKVFYFRFKMLKCLNRWKKLQKEHLDRQNNINKQPSSNNNYNNQQRPNNTNTSTTNRNVVISNNNNNNNNNNNIPTSPQSPQPTTWGQTFTNSIDNNLGHLRRFAPTTIVNEQIIAMQHAMEYNYFKRQAAKASAELTSILRHIQLLPPVHNQKEEQFFHIHSTIDLLRSEQLQQTKLIGCLSDTVGKLYSKLERQEEELNELRKTNKKNKTTSNKKKSSNSSSNNNMMLLSEGTSSSSGSGSSSAAGSCDDDAEDEGDKKQKLY